MQSNITFKEMSKMGNDLAQLQERRRRLQNPTVQKQVAAHYMEFISKQSSNLRTEYLRPTSKDSTILC